MRVGLGDEVAKWVKRAPLPGLAVFNCLDKGNHLRERSNYLLFGVSFVAVVDSPGWMTPQEIKNLNASSTETSTGRTSFWGVSRTKPDMGWGAVGTKIAQSVSPPSFLRMSGVGPVRKPMLSTS